MNVRGRLGKLLYTERADDMNVGSSPNQSCRTRTAIKTKDVCCRQHPTNTNYTEKRRWWRVSIFPRKMYKYLWFSWHQRQICVPRLCNALAVMKTADLEPHCSSKHANLSELGGQMHLEETSALQRRLESQQGLSLSLVVTGTMLFILVGVMYWVISSQGSWGCR